ncbi:MAG TPA: SDR family oxidoreductase [Xanthobacteraceae bacterium]|nr:SDR family oxidoreductase [Xanthobacteraceae bacterium]
MTKELEGRVAIVTGAGRNIGRGIALALADGGAAVVVNARSNMQEAQAVAGEIERAGGKALAVTADVADADAVGKMVAAAAKKFGRIDILVNNAAVRVEQAFEGMTLQQWRAVTSIILDGAFNCVQACLPYLKKSGHGVVINIGGLSAHTGAARRPHVVSAKAGLIGLTRALAHELAPDHIRVNTVTPGLMSAPRPAGQPEPQHHALVKSLAGRRGEPADIAAIVRFLCGPGAGFITGQNMQVNGGTFLS